MKKNFILLLLLVISIFGIKNVEAKDNKIKFNDEVTISEKKDGALFANGDRVVVTEETSVDGILFAVASDLSISGINQYLLALGNNIKLDEMESNDSFIIGNNIDLDNVKLSRDLYILGNSVEINGEIDRNIYLACGSVNISGTINGNIYIASPKITIEKDTTINGKIMVPENTLLTADDTYNVERYKEINTKKTFIDKIIAKLISFFNVLIVGLLLFAVFKKLDIKIDSKDHDFITILKKIGFGLIGILVGILVSLIALILMFSKVFLAISIILIALYIFAIYVSIIISSYYISSNVLKNVIKNKYLLLIIGLFITYLIYLIPFVGGIFYFMMVLLGLGIIIDLLFVKEK